jgi:hypothetical protein
MAMIPLNDTLTIKRATGFDDWGKPIGEVEIVVKCRIDYSTQIVKDKNGADVVSKANILIDAFVEVQYEDTLEWTDPNGHINSESAVSIGYIKDFSSKVLFTKVVV